MITFENIMLKVSMHALYQKKNYLLNEKTYYI